MNIYTVITQHDINGRLILWINKCRINVANLTRLDRLFEGNFVSLTEDIFIRKGKFMILLFIGIKSRQALLILLLIGIKI